VLFAVIGLRENIMEFIAVKDAKVSTGIRICLKNVVSLMFISLFGCAEVINKPSNVFFRLFEHGPS